jgi:hypothetical protein
VSFEESVVEEGSGSVIVSVTGRMSIWTGVRGITKEEPPHVVMYAEPRFVEEVQDIGVNGGHIIRGWVCLRPCRGGTEQEK